MSANYLRYGYFLFDKTTAHPIIIQLDGVESYFIAPSLMERYWSNHVDNRDELRRLARKQAESSVAQGAEPSADKSFVFDEREGVVPVDTPRPFGDGPEEITTYFLMRTHGGMSLITIFDPVGWGNADLHPMRTRLYVKRGGYFVLLEENYEEYNIEWFGNTVGLFGFFVVILSLLYAVSLVVKRAGAIRRPKDVRDGQE